MATLERLIFTVDVSVIPQVVLSPERFATYITAVRPLISVGSLVNQKIVGLSELSITELTDELLLLKYSVHRKSSRLTKPLAAFTLSSIHQVAIMKYLA